MKFGPQSTAFVFPGQGSQAVGMGRDLAARYPIARETFEEADSILGFPLSHLMWEGSESDLNDTVNTQPALFVHSLAAWRTFTQSTPLRPGLLAGHSLGELSALAASGALSFVDGLKLVRLRGELMKRAGEANPGGMAAILGVDILTLEKVCADATTSDAVVQVANDNCPGQVVISGHISALEKAMEGARAAGAKRAKALAVSIAAHSPLMNSIQAEWDGAVDSCIMENASIPVVGNVAARVMKSVFDLRTDLKAQMQSRVRWTESVEAMRNLGIQAYVEAGSGDVLLGLIKRIDPSAARFPFGKPEDLIPLEL